LGKPSIKLKGSTANFLRKKIKTKKYSIHLSLSDDLPWANATVIISYN
jgi:phosphopantetheinyl transferase (holo-ACP synthase)